MKRPKLLDLFCCQGGASAGYTAAGFDVTGVDNEPQPRYPFTFVQGDALTYLQDHGHEYDAISASPPCQGHTQARHAWGRQYSSAPLLLDTIAALQGQALPWVVENVGAASMVGALTLCGTSFGLGLHRHRRFETSFPALAPPCDPSRVMYRGREAEIFGHHGNTTRIREEWGVPWMDQYGIAQCIPPAFACWLGELLLEHLAVAA